MAKKNSRNQLEQDILDEIDDNLKNPELIKKFKTKKKTIDQFLDSSQDPAPHSNGNIHTEKASNKKKIGVTFKPSIDDKNTGKDKKEMSKVNSNFIRQNTGINPETRTIMDNFQKQGEEIKQLKKDIEKYNQDKSMRLNSNSSEVAYRPKADWDSDKKIHVSNSSINTHNIYQDDISNSLADLRLLFQVFEDDSCKFLFKDKSQISIEDATTAFAQNLKLPQDLARKLSLYIFQNLETINKMISSKSLFDELKKVVGNYIKYDSEDFQKLVGCFMLPENQAHKSRFMNEMVDLTHVENITRNEFDKTMSQISMDINLKCLIVMLLRESKSLQLISKKSIKSFIDRINNEEKDYGRSASVTSKSCDITDYDDFNENQQKEEQQYESNLQDLSLNKKFFVRLADFMFNNDLTLHQIIHTKIYDKMFNGREYELINPRSFFSLLDDRGFKVPEDEQKAISNLLKNSYLINVLEVDKISKVLEELDIYEDVPPSSKNYNYKNLRAPDIRVMNCLVNYMDEQNIEDIEDFIGKENISVIEVIGNKKREDIHYTSTDQFLEVLTDKNLIDDDELNEGLQLFFALSEDNIDKLMIRKIKKCIKDFRTVKFFSYFGTQFRDQEMVLSDDEEEQPVKLGFNDNNRATMKQKAEIIENCNLKANSKAKK